MTTEQAPDGEHRLVHLGAACWRLLGLVAGVTLIALAIGALSGIVIPLVVAIYVAILAVRLVDRLAVLRVPRPLGSLVVMVGIVAVFVGAFALAGVGIANQGGEIRDEVAAGLDAVIEWYDQLDLGSGNGQDAYQSIFDAGKQVLPGAASYVATVFNSVVAFVFGVFLGLFILYYLLTDWTAITEWVGKHLGVGGDVGMRIIDDAASVMRANFAALTVSSLIVSAIIGAAMLILGLPLVFTVIVVTFLTSYIPYLGAIVSGAFGFLIALGSGGTTDAVILLIVILVAQNLVQTVVGNKLASHQLAVHPLAAFLATVVGASVAGLFGAVLAAPLLALGIAIQRELRAARIESGRTR